MTYELEFLPIAKKEWDMLNPVVREAFKNKLIKRLQNPEVSKDRLSGNLKDCYKIKLLKMGYRLVYKVNKTRLVILVIAIGKREKYIVYENAKTRIMH